MSKDLGILREIYARLTGCSLCAHNRLLRKSNFFMWRHALFPSSMMRFSCASSKPNLLALPVKHVSPEPAEVELMYVDNRQSGTFQVGTAMSSRARRICGGSVTPIRCLSLSRSMTCSRANSHRIRHRTGSRRSFFCCPSSPPSKRVFTPDHPRIAMQCIHRINMSARPVKLCHSIYRYCFNSFVLYALSCTSD